MSQAHTYSLTEISKTFNCLLSMLLYGEHIHVRLREKTRILKDHILDETSGNISLIIYMVITTIFYIKITFNFYHITTQYFLPLLTSKFRKRVRASEREQIVGHMLWRKEKSILVTLYLLGNRIPGMTGLSHRVTPGLPGRIPGWMTTHQPALPFKSVMKHR